MELEKCRYSAEQPFKSQKPRWLATYRETGFPSKSHTKRVPLQKKTQTHSYNRTTRPPQTSWIPLLKRPKERAAASRLARAPRRSSKRSTRRAPVGRLWRPGGSPWASFQTNQKGGKPPVATKKKRKHTRNKKYPEGAGLAVF